MSQKLRKSDIISPATGAAITFHMIRWGNQMDSLTLQTGGNLLFHKLADDTVEHSHDFGEICIILKGQINHHVNGRTDLLTGGTLVFIRPDDSHSFQQYKQESCELVNFAFDTAIIDDLETYLHNDKLRWMWEGHPTPPTYKVSVSEGDELSVQLLTINTLQITDVVSAGLRIRKILADLFITYILSMPKYGVPETKEKDVPKWLVRLCNSMKKDENLRGGLKKLQEMAACTPEHLCASFRKYLNKTPTEFLNELRVNKAARRLVEGDEKVMAIAYDLGFRSQSRFYQVFRKHYNVSPARYRALSQQNDIPIKE
jgi:AraC family cel operon transcriptional repressor